MRAIRHIGIVVKDLDKALHFYRDLLGLKVNRAMDEGGPYLERLLALPGVRVETVKLSAETGPTLVELLHFKSHDSDDAGSREIYAIGPSHLAFTVDNLDEMYKRLSTAGVTFNSPPLVSPDGNAKVAYCCDPGGTPVELVQVLSDTSVGRK